MGFFVVALLRMTADAPIVIPVQTGMTVRPCRGGSRITPTLQLDNWARVVVYVHTKPALLGILLCCAPQNGASVSRRESTAQWNALDSRASRNLKPMPAELLINWRQRVTYSAPSAHTPSFASSMPHTSGMRCSSPSFCSVSGKGLPDARSKPTVS